MRRGHRLLEKRRQLPKRPVLKSSAPLAAAGGGVAAWGHVDASLGPHRAGECVCVGRGSADTGMPGVSVRGEGCVLRGGFEYCVRRKRRRKERRRRACEELLSLLLMLTCCAGVSLNVQRQRWQ